MALHAAMTPRHMPDPGPPPTPEKTMSRWSLFLGSVASGMLLPDAMLKHYMTRADIEACVRLGPEERQRWDEARLAAQKKNWSAFDLEDVLQKIAGGEKIRDAIEAVKPGGAGYHGFMDLVIQDAEFHERYLRSLKARSLLVGEEIVEIADDDSQDVLHNEKGPLPNNAAVNRSKLRVETRQRLMSSWYPKLFGEQKQAVTVAVQINHAEKLEAARTRAKTQSAIKRVTPAVIEAAFTEIKDDPLDTGWLES